MFLVAAHIIGLVSLSSGLVQNYAFQSFTSIPATVDLTVTELNLRSNNIDEIQQNDLSALLLLEILNLKDNAALHTVHPRAFENNSYLKDVNLMGCSIPIPPANFGGAWEHIEVVAFFNQKVPMTFPTDNLGNIIYFNNWPKLRALRLGYVEGLSGKLLLDCPEVEEISIQETGLDEIPDFRLLPQVKIYKGWNNNYRDLGYILSLTQLEIINVRDNLLETFPDMHDYPLKLLAIRGNPYVCNESMCWLRMWDYTHNSTVDSDSDTTCAAPVSLAGARLMGVRPSAFGCFNDIRFFEFFTQYHVLRNDTFVPAYEEARYFPNNTVPLVTRSHVECCVVCRRSDQCVALHYIVNNKSTGQGDCYLFENIP